MSALYSQCQAYRPVPKPIFYVGARDLNSGPHACAAGTLLAKPSPQSPLHLLNLKASQGQRYFHPYFTGRRGDGERLCQCVVKLILTLVHTRSRVCLFHCVYCLCSIKMEAVTFTTSGSGGTTQWTTTVLLFFYFLVYVRHVQECTCAWFLLVYEHPSVLEHVEA